MAQDKLRMPRDNSHGGKFPSITQLVRDHLALDSDVPGQKTRSVVVFIVGHSVFES